MSVLTRQPQGFARVNQQWRERLFAAFNFGSGLFDAVSGRLAVNVGTTREVCPIGVGIKAITAGFYLPWKICWNTSRLNWNKI